MLTSSNILAITGIDQNLLQRWVTRGFVEPTVNEGGGPGNHRQYTPMQATALLIGSRLHQLGCTDKMIGPLMEFVSNMSEKEMVRQAKKGNTFVLPTRKPQLSDTPVPPKMDQEAIDWLGALSLTENYERVLERTDPTDDILPVAKMRF